MMIKVILIIFSTNKGLSRERQTFVLGRMEAASPVSPVFGGRKYTVMSFSTLSDAKRDTDGASHRFLKAKELEVLIACDMQFWLPGRLSADCVVVNKKNEQAHPFGTWEKGANSIHPK